MCMFMDCMTDAVYIYVRLTSSVLRSLYLHGITVNPYQWTVFPVPVPPNQRKSVVYQIPCSDSGTMYVGQTGRTLQVRKKEHVWALTNSDSMTSVLAEHTMDTMHKIAWEDAEVLASNPHPHQRCAIEAWHIWSQPLRLNREAGLLPPVYNGLINKPS